MRKHFLLTPGPTPIPPEVSLKEALPILHHRTSEFEDIFTEVIEGLKYIFQTTNDVLIITSSGTGAMESAVVNLLSSGDEALVASCGNFGNRWAKICAIYGIKVTKIEAEWGKCVEPKKIEEALKANKNIKAVFTTHTETSTGVVNDLKTIGETVKKTDAVLVVDAISGLAGQDLRTDAWSLDVVVSGSQKGLMCAPGLSFAAVGPKAWPLIEKSTSPRFYFDFRSMKKNIAKKQTPFTPAVTLFAAIAESIRIIKKDGLENIFARTERLSRACRAGIRALGLELLVDDSCACTVLTSAKMPANIDGDKVVGTLRREYGISIAGGQDLLKGKIIRFAHMGYIDQFDLFVGLTGLEIVMSKFGHKVEFGKSIAAAQQVLMKQ